MTFITSSPVLTNCTVKTSSKQRIFNKLCCLAAQTLKRCKGKCSLQKASTFVAGCYMGLFLCFSRGHITVGVGYAHIQWETRPPKERLPGAGWLGLSADHPPPVSERLERLRMNTAVERNTGMAWVSPRGLLPITTIQTRRASRDHRGTWTVFCGTWQINVRLELEESKRLVEGL